MAKTCDVCGAPSGFFPLCKECNELKEQGIVYKDELKGRWIMNKENDVREEQKRQKDGKCVVCGEDAPNGSLCRDCWYEMLDYKDSFDKNSKVFELKDYYFNLRSNIYRMKNPNFILSNCNKLMALASLTKDLFHDDSLTARAVNDIKEIVEKKIPNEEKTNENQSRISQLDDSRKEEVLRTRDGHYVKSDPEREIDDILYSLRIVHCYEKNVPTSIDEATVKCDWFIPVNDDRHGIYIEYWGMNTKSYLENKERKRKAYKENNIPLIEIEKDDPKDTQGLEDRLLREINTLANKYYGRKNFIH